MKKLNFLLYLFLFVLVIGGCARNNRKDVASCEDFILALEDKGYQVDETEASAQSSFFSVPEKTVKAGYITLSIYEFENSDKAESEAATILNHGYEINHSFVRWAGIPHFYYNGNIIVQFIGSHEQIEKDLEDILGKPI